MLSETQISAIGREALERHGYRTCALPREWERKEEAYLFEDEYSIVAMVVYGTAGELLNNWTDDQAILIGLISEHIGRGEAKAAEGYLLLLTSGEVTEKERDSLASIRYDTSRVRKLVATGGELRLKSDVERVLSPLLPLAVEDERSDLTLGLEELPELLELPREATRALGDAYANQTSLLEALSEYLQSR